MNTVGDELPREQARCRELLRQYQSLGPVGKFGYLMIEAVMKRADVAVASGDVIAMIRSLEELRGCQ